MMTMMKGFWLCVGVAAALVCMCRAEESCSPRSDEVSPPFDNVECFVTKEFKLHCRVTVQNSDPAWTDRGILVVDFGYRTVAPQRIIMPEYSAEKEAVDLDAETDLLLEGAGPLMSLPPEILVKLFANDGRTATHTVHTWVGMFTDAMIPDTSDVPEVRDVLLVGMRGAGKSSLTNSLVHVHYRFRPRKYMFWRPVEKQFAAISFTQIESGCLVSRL